MNITHAELVAGLKKPGEAIIQSLTPEKADLWHMASCVPGEVGELLEALRNNDRTNIKEELGDVKFYLEGVRQNQGLTRDIYVDLVSIDSSYLPFYAGELFDAVKKHVIYNKEMNREKLVAALVSVEACLLRIEEETGISHDEACAGNIEKLSVRYQGIKYSDEAAQNRADKPAGE